ncbi:MAG: ABC transporter permease [Aerococcaceae bacterium]|nr:ABC transporter permease [Aerococcaceae bacterium]
MKLAWKEIRHQVKKFLLVEILIFLMMFMVIFLSGLTQGLGRATSAQIDNYGDVQYILTEDAEGIIPFSSLEDKQREAVNNLADQKALPIAISRSGISFEASEGKKDVTYFVVENDSFLAPKATDGENLSSQVGGIVLDSSFEAKGLKIGDIVIDSATEYTLTILGFTKDAMYEHSNIGFITPATFEELKKVSNPQYEWQPQAYVLTETLSNNDKTSLEDVSLAVLSKQEVISKIPGYAAEQLTLTTITWVLILVSAAILGVFFYILTLQKLKSFGVLKAIGMSMGEITRIQLVQIFILGLIGVSLGAFAAWSMAQFLPSSMPFYLKNQDIVMVSASFIAISVLSGLLSVWKIRQVDPVHVIGGSED